MENLFGGEREKISAGDDWGTRLSEKISDNISGHSKQFSFK